MSAQPDLNQLLQQMSRLTKAIENSSASSDTYSVRAGRGGNSNGRVSSVDGGEANAKATERALENLEKSLNRNGSASDQWGAAIRNATGVTRIFGETTKQMLSRIDSNNQTQTEGTRQVTESMQKLVKVNGLNSLAVQKANAVSFSMIDAMKAVTDKHHEMTQAATERQAIEDEITRKTVTLANTKGKNNKQAIRDEIAALKIQKDAIRSQKDYSDDLDNLRTELVTLTANIDTDTNPAFKHLSANTLAVIKGQNNANASIDELSDAVEELTPLVNAQGNATRALASKAAGIGDAMETARGQIANAMLGLGKGLLNSAGGIIENFREQVKYNVRESNYDSAALLGMSDGERSKLLGSNVETFRGITGSSDNEQIDKSGQLMAGKDIIRDLLGEAGLQGGERYAQIARMSQESGVSLRKDPNGIIGQRVADMSVTADMLGMVKSDLISFTDDLVKSGDMALIAAKHADKTGAAQAHAIDMEIRSRLKQTKLMGLSNEMLRARMQYERSQKFGTLEHMLKGQLGAGMEAAAATSLGVGYSKEEKAAGERIANGIGKGDDFKIATAAKNRLTARANELRNQATATGDINLSRKVAGYNQLLQNMGSNALSEAESVETEKGTQKVKGLEVGAETYSAGPKNAGDKNSYNSGYLPGEQDWMFSKGKEFVDGVKANPLFNIAMNVVGIAAGVATLVVQGYALATLMAAQAAGGGGMGGTGKFGKLAKVGFGVAGIAGTAAAFGGDYIKDRALKNGAANNNTILDGDTAGAAISVLGNAAQGAALGAIVGPVGAAVGAALGATYGVVENFDTIERNFQTLAGDLFSPEKKLEEAKTEARKAREEQGDQPIKVQITGPEADAIRSTSIDVSKQTDLSKTQTVLLNRQQDARKAEADVRATMEAKMQNINATATNFQDMSN